MKNKIKSIRYNMIFVLLIFIAFISMSTMILVYSPAYAFSEVGYISGQVKTSYIHGESFDALTAKIEDNKGGELDATLDYLVFPDGINRKISNSVELKDCGRYTAVYSSGDKFARKSFDVVSRKYEGVAKQPEVKKNFTFNHFSVERTMDCLYLSLGKNETFVMNEPIYLDPNNMSEALTFYVDTTSSNGRAGFNKINFTFTDIYDKDNVVGITFEYVQGNGYWRAGSSNQIHGGLEMRNKQSTILIDGQWYAFLTKYGAGDTLSSKIGNTIVFEDQTKRVYVRSEPKWFKREYKIVNDLDEEKLVGNKKWGGFTTGEVYMTISAEGIVGEDVDLCITKIGNKHGDELENYDYKDEVKPVISLKDYDDSSMLKIAKNEPFPLFESSVLDAKCSGEVKKAVYYNYGSKGQVRINVNDGKFIPKVLGKYTIEYTVTDDSGNIGKKIVQLDCVDTKSGKSMELTYDKLDNIIAGQEYNLLNYKVSSLNGKENVQIFVIDPQGNEEKVDGKFFPIYQGKYTIKYVYSSGVMKYEDYYEVDCLSSDKVIIDGAKFTHPIRYIYGLAYSLDDIYAYTFDKQSPQKHLVKYEIKKDSGVYEDILDKDEVIIDAKENVQFRFSYNKESVESEVIGIQDVQTDGVLDLSKYFVKDNMNALSTDEDVRFNTLNNNQNARIDFINPVLVSYLQLGFKFNIQKINWKEFKIIISDYKDANRKQVITYKLIRDSLVVSSSVLGEEYSLDKTLDSAFSIEYQSSKNAIVTNDGKILGTCFNELDKCNIAFEICQNEKESEFSLQRINNQSFARTDDDYQQGEFYAQRITGHFIKGDRVKIGLPITADVLSTIINKNICVTVKNPKGEIISSDDGITLDNAVLNREYDITLDMLGSYNIKYSITDSKNNIIDKAAVNIIKVVDNEPPQATIENKVETAKVGERVNLATCNYSDNVTSKENIMIISVVYDNYGVMVSMDADYFIAKNKGVHTVYYYLLDENGNSNMLSYKINII